MRKKRAGMSGAKWLIVLAFALAWLGASAARAAEAASDWFVTDQGRVRLVAAAPSVGDGEAVQLGLDFRLAPHWKIYWRSPGDAGYPPRLDWARSTNLAGATMAWPAPQRFSVLGLDTVGYDRRGGVADRGEAGAVGTGGASASRAVAISPARRSASPMTRC